MLPILSMFPLTTFHFGVFYAYWDIFDIMFSLQVCRHFHRFFMEKQVMGELVRILRISRTVIVSLQLLQTMSIVIQNLKNEHSICKWTVETCCTESIFFFFMHLLVWHFTPNFADYMFSNEHINHLITYSFDFRNEELLSYYISFLRCVLWNSAALEAFPYFEILFL